MFDWVKLQWYGFVNKSTYIKYVGLLKSKYLERSSFSNYALFLNSLWTVWSVYRTNVSVSKQHLYLIIGCRCPRGGARQWWPFTSSGLCPTPFISSTWTSPTHTCCPAATPRFHCCSSKLWIRRSSSIKSLSGLSTRRDGVYTCQ